MTYVECLVVHFEERPDDFAPRHGRTIAVRDVGVAPHVAGSLVNGNKPGETKGKT